MESTTPRRKSVAETFDCGRLADSCTEDRGSFSMRTPSGEAQWLFDGHALEESACSDVEGGAGYPTQQRLDQAACPELDRSVHQHFRELGDRRRHQASGSAEQREQTVADTVGRRIPVVHQKRPE